MLNRSIVPRMPSNRRPTRASRRSPAATSGAGCVVCIMTLRASLNTASLTILRLTRAGRQEKPAGPLAEWVADSVAPAEMVARGLRATLLRSAHVEGIGRREQEKATAAVGPERR